MSDLLPDFMVSPEIRAERAFDDEAKGQALDALHARHRELVEAELGFDGAEAFMEGKRSELAKVQEALLFSRGETTLLLQGRGQSLWDFVHAPGKIREERVRVEAQIADIENPTPG
jgi:hypothetical protein